MAAPPQHKGNLKCYLNDHPPPSETGCRTESEAPPSRERLARLAGLIHQDHQLDVYQIS